MLFCRKYTYWAHLAHILHTNCAHLAHILHTPCTHLAHLANTQIHLHLHLHLHSFYWTPFLLLLLVKWKNLVHPWGVDILSTLILGGCSVLDVDADNHDPTSHSHEETESKEESKIGGRSISARAGDSTVKRFWCDNMQEKLQLTELNDGKVFNPFAFNLNNRCCKMHGYKKSWGQVLMQPRITFM